MCVPFHEASPARIHTREKPKPKQWRHTVAGAMGRVHHLCSGIGVAAAMAIIIVAP